MSNNERWKPADQDIYYYVDSDLSVVEEYWDGESYMDKSHYGNYNCFKTEAEAKVVAEKFKKLLKTIHDCSEQPTKVEQLPKLTVEIFDRPYCPEWAKYAAVDKDGKGFYYRDKPKKKESKTWSLFGVGAWHYIGKFDASDWKNSLIERPNKKDELHEWIKIGEWVYGLDIYGKGKYFKITNIQNNYVYGDECCVKSLFVSQARLRPYNAEEMRSLVGKVVTAKNGDASLIAYYERDCNRVYIFDNWFTEKELLNSTWYINGAKCGVLEHLNEDGEWVE